MLVSPPKGHYRGKLREKWEFELKYSFFRFLLVFGHFLAICGHFSAIYGHFSSYSIFPKGKWSILARLSFGKIHTAPPIWPEGNGQKSLLFFKEIWLIFEKSPPVPVVVAILTFFWSHIIFISMRPVHVKFLVATTNGSKMVNFRASTC